MPRPARADVAPQRSEIRASLANAPRAILTPLVAILGMVSHHASDAAYVVFIPLAAIVYAAAGRHPVAGLAAAFATIRW